MTPQGALPARAHTPSYFVDNDPPSQPSHFNKPLQLLKGFYPRAHAAGAAWLAGTVIHCTSPVVWLYGSRPLTAQAVRDCSRQLLQEANEVRGKHTDLPLVLLQPTSLYAWDKPEIPPGDLHSTSYRDFYVPAEDDIPRAIVRIGVESPAAADWQALQEIAQQIGSQIAALVVVDGDSGRSELAEQATDGILRLLQAQQGSEAYKLPDLSLALVEVQTTAGDLSPTMWEQIEAIIAANSRSSDYIAPMSSGTFAIVMPDTDARGALIGADRLRKVVEEFARARNVELRVCIGVSSWDPDRNAEQLLWEASQALRQAKNNGHGAAFLYV